jgi:hypothetical protein
VTQFPAGAAALGPEAMKERFAPGSEFTFRSAEGYEVRVSFQAGGPASVVALYWKRLSNDEVVRPEQK